jgi:hypothetical protein
MHLYIHDKHKNVYIHVFMYVFMYVCIEEMRGLKRVKISNGIYTCILYSDYMCVYVYIYVYKHIFT